MTTDRPRFNIRKKLVREVVEELHDQLREQGAFKAPIPVEKIAKAMNVKVTYVDTEDPDLSGFFYRDPHTGKAVIGINASHYRTRQRFTLAHELGHLMIHSFEDLHYDRKGSGGIRNRDALSSTGENREEMEANLFAAELLMPEELIFDKLEETQTDDIFGKNIDSVVRTMAKEFQVSSQALNIRMNQLGIVSIA